MTNHTVWKVLEAVSFVAVILMSVLLISCLSGCSGPRLTDAQAAELAQARANTCAARRASDVDAANTLTRAACARSMAAIADLELPDPATPDTALVATDGTPHADVIHAESVAADASEKHPPEGNHAWAWVGGAGLLALGVLRLSPGLFGGVANLAYAYLAPLATRQMRERQQQGALIAEHAIAYGAAVTATATAAGLGEQVERIKVVAAVAQDRLGIRDQVQAILASFKTQAVPISQARAHAEPSNSG